MVQKTRRYAQTLSPRQQREAANLSIESLATAVLDAYLPGSCAATCLFVSIQQPYAAATPRTHSFSVGGLPKAMMKCLVRDGNMSKRLAFRRISPTHRHIYIYIYMPLYGSPAKSLVASPTGITFRYDNNNKGNSKNKNKK